MSTKTHDRQQSYSTSQVAEITGLTMRHVARLVDAGYFPGAHRASPVPGSPRRIPAEAVKQFLLKRQA